MEAAEAFSLVSQFILWRDLDYTTDGLRAERCARASVGVPGG